MIPFTALSSGVHVLISTVLPPLQLFLHYLEGIKVSLYALHVRRFSPLESGWSLCHLHCKSSLWTIKQPLILAQFWNSLHCLGECLLELCTLYQGFLSFWRDGDIFFLSISKLTLFTSKKSGVQPPTLISYLTASSSLFPFAYRVQLLPGVILQVWATLPVLTPWNPCITYSSLMQLKCSTELRNT